MGAARLMTQERSARAAAMRSHPEYTWVYTLVLVFVLVSPSAPEQLVAEKLVAEKLVAEKLVAEKLVPVVAEVAEQLV
jgi:hypothetical protein